MGSSRRRVSLVLVALMQSFAVVASTQQRPSASLRAEFVRAMDEVTHRKEETKRQTSLMTRLLQNAKVVKTAFAPPPQDEERKLSYNGNYNYGYYNYQNNYGNNNYQNNDDANNQQQQQQGGEGDDAFAAYGGLNLTKYALKYLGCQNIHTFSDEMAADEEASGVLTMGRFVVFRLCPKESCSNYNEWGCDYNYGEYTIPMDDYLATMQTYHIEQYQTYCKTCASCMTGTGDFQYNNGQQNRKLNNGGGGQYYYYSQNSNYYNQNYQQANDDGANYQDNDDAVNYQQYNNADDYAAAANDDGGNDDGNNYAANDDANGDDAVASNETSSNSNCAYADVCASYQQACGSETFDDDNYQANAASMAQYFECSELNVGGVASYLGPHCRSDGFTIGIGIYADQYCSSYVGDVVDMEQVTGQTYDDEYLSPYYPKQCISCAARESYDLLTDDEMDNEENGGLYEVCGYLYEQAAKCNRYLADGDNFQGQYEQEANEEDVCNFVASLVENNYDEYGEAYLESPEWELSKWKEVNAYRQDLVKASSAQILGICFSVGLCLILSLYSVYLRYKLTRRLPWSRGFGSSKAAGDAGKLGRVSSGITMQRSLSGVEPQGSFA